MNSHDLSQACPGHDENKGMYARLAGLKSRLNLDFETLSSFLRLVGAGVVVCALSMFLFKDWQHGDDITRYLVLLGFTAILALTGLICGRWIQEGKGARLFLALGLASVPVNFTILGALAYSQWQLDGLPQGYPSYWLWQATDPQFLAGLMVIAWLVMAAVSWLGGRVLTPRSVRPFTLLLLLNSSLLLIPTRDTLFVVGTGVVMACAILFTLKRQQTADRTLSNKEGIFVRLLQVMPLLLLFGRAFVLYGFDSWMYALLALTWFIMLRQLGQSMGESSVWCKRLETLSVGPALVAMGFIGNILFNLGVPDSWIVPLLVVLFSAMMIELSIHCAGSGHRFGRIACLTLVVGSSLHLYIESTMFSAVFCMVCGMAVIAMGFLKKQPASCLLGVLGFVYGLVYQLIMAYAFFDLGRWGTLGVIGVLSILAGSLLERYGLQWKTRYQRWIAE